MTPWVIGVDPGGRETGIVLCNARAVLDRVVLVSQTPAHHVPDSAYLNKVVDQIDAYREFADDEPIIAVEGVVRPNPHMGLTAVMPLVGTGMVFGMVLGVYRHAIVVRPQGHGSKLLTAYPEELRPTRGTGKGADQLRHTRSAYDIAHAGRILAGRQAA